MTAKRHNIASQYSTSVTTGQGEYEWTNKINMGAKIHTRSSNPPSAIPSYTSIDGSAPIVKMEPTKGVQSGAVGFEGWQNAVDSTRKDSDSMESMQQHVNALDPPMSDPESLTVSESEDSDDEEELKAGLVSHRHMRIGSGPATVLIRGPKEKKKVGRPIAYRGDPDSPELTEQERRRIKRRIANRESARRVRYKRQEMLDDLQVKIDVLQSQNAELRSRATESKHETEEVSEQLREMTAKYKEVMTTNEHMHLELESLRTSLQMRMSMLETALDRQDIGPDAGDEKSLFGSMQAQSVTNPGYCSQPTFPFSAPGDFKGSYSFQMALDNFPSLQLAERPGDIFTSETSDTIFKANKPPASSSQHL